MATPPAAAALDSDKAAGGGSWLKDAAYCESVRRVVDGQGAFLGGGWPLGLQDAYSNARRKRLAPRPLNPEPLHQWLHSILAPTAAHQNVPRRPTSVAAVGFTSSALTSR